MGITGAIFVFSRAGGGMCRGLSVVSNFISFQTMGIDLALMPPLNDRVMSAILKVLLKLPGSDVHFLGTASSKNHED